MEETVRLMEQEVGAGGAAMGAATGAATGAGAGGMGRRSRLLAAGALLLLSSLYFFSRPPQLPPARHPFGFSNPYKKRIQMDSVFPGYLIWTPSCKIPDIDPYLNSSMKIFHRKKYIPCQSGQEVFTYVNDDSEGNGILQINKAAFHKLKKSLSCCYYNVTYPKDPSTAAANIVSSPCQKFENSVKLKNTEEFVVTNCQINTGSLFSSKKIYKSAHTNIQHTDAIKERLALNAEKYTKDAWNVLIIGVDTLSRINLARAMPKTHHFLKNSSWLDFQAYNKMDDNTFPNIMAILTGRNQSRARYTCDGKDKYSPDNCDYMWKQYQERGYVTAYAEDYVDIDTFGKSLHKGFNKPPTDHYLRPLFVATEKRVRKPNGQDVHCAGQLTSGEVLFKYALNFVNKYQNDPFFGFFWANSFSHDDVDTPSTMDEKMLDFLISLNKSEIINNTVILFISDHGIRYGKLRATLDGYYEERLPSMFAWLPSAFREQYPDAYNSMRVNTRRLTTPYDLHMTLQDILHFSGRKDELVPSEGCPNCQSLFQPVPWNRSCEDCALSPHWCACILLKPLSLDNKITKLAVKYIIETEIKRLLDTVNTPSCRMCAKVTLDKVLHIYQYEYSQHENTTNYLVVFSTNPEEMVFESTVRFDNVSETFEILGIISRLSPYKGKGGCVKTAHLKKYCHCTGKCSKL